MAVTIRPFTADIDLNNIVEVLRTVLGDLEDQLNERAQIYVSTSGQIPTNLNRNDILIIDFKGKIQLLIKEKDGYRSLAASMLGGLTANGNNLLTQQTVAAAPVLANFPNNGDFGFFHNTAGGTFFLCANISNSLKKVALT